MISSRNMFFMAMVAAFAVAAQMAFADASADSIMLRKKSAPTESAVQVAAEPVAAKSVAAKSIAAEVAAEPVAAEPVAKQAEVSVEKAAAEKTEDKDAKKKTKSKASARDAVITADRTDYDRKEGVVLFDRNVCVDDEQYQMHTDRLFLFLDGTNDLKRLVAIGNVAITNENRRAYCARATFNRKLGRIVMYSSDETVAELREEGKKGSEVKGEKITFWIDSEQVEVENPVITMPGGFGGKDSLKKAMGR